MGVKSEMMVISRWRVNGRGALMLGFLFLGLFALSAAPTFLWSDSSKLALYVHDRVLGGTGFEKHFMHTWFGLLFSYLPVGFAYSQNLLSAFFGALTVVGWYAVLRGYGIERVPAGLTAASVGVSHLFWLYSSINETYTMVTFFMVAVWWCIQRWTETGGIRWLFIAATLSGMGFANHGMFLLFLPAFFMMMANKSRFRASLREWTGRLAILVTGFMLGAFPIFIIPLIQSEGLRVIFEGLMKTISEHTQYYMGGIRKFIREVTRFPFYLAYQYPGVGFFILIGGVVHGWRSLNRWHRYAVSWLVVVPMGFALRYFLQRQFAMLIPVFLVLSLFLAYGIRVLLDRYRHNQWAPLVLGVLLVGLPPFIYAATYQVARHLDIPLPIRRLPYRDTYRYFLFPPKWMERGAEHYVNDAFRQARRNAVILSDFNPGMALLYAQKVRGDRPDLTLDIRIDTWIHRYGDPAPAIIRYLKTQVIDRGRTVYLADRWPAYYRPSVIRRCFKLIQTGGPLWEVVPKQSGNAGPCLNKLLEMLNQKAVTDE